MAANTSTVPNNITYPINIYEKGMLICLISIEILINLCITSTNAAPLRQQTDVMILRRVVVVSLDPAQESILRNAIPIDIGQVLTPLAIDQMEHNLAAAGLPMDRLKVGLLPYSDDANIDNASSGNEGVSTSDGVQLIFDYSHPLSIAKVNILPLVQTDVEHLRSICPIDVGDTLNQNDLEAAAEALREAIHTEGIINATVTLHQTPLTTSTVSIGFIIESAAPVILHKRRYSGAGWLNASRIREQLKHMEPVPFDKGTTVTAEVLQKSEYIATAVMRSLGYLEAQACLTETMMTAKGLDVTYQIERGPRFRIASSQATGNEFPDPVFWESVTRNCIKKPITSQRIDELKKAIEQKAGYEGYMAPKIELDVAPSLTEYTVAINAHVDEGTTSSLGSIRINRDKPDQGYGTSWYHRHIAPPLPEEIIRKQIRARSGEALNGRVTDDATQRLMRLNTFEDVKVETAPTSDTFVRDIVAGVTEKRTAYAGLSLGWNDQTGPVSRLTFTEKNVGGRADVLSLGLNLSLDERALGGEISYLDRYWKTGERWLGEEREPSLLWSAFLTESSYDQYTERREGGALRLGYLIGDALGPWSNGWQARLERITYDPFQDRGRYNEKFCDYLAATIAYDLTYDRLERGEWDSMRGLLVNTTLETGAADGFLLDWTTRMDWRRPIARRWVWQVQGEVGLMPVSASQVGIGHRFQAGGMDGIRGFEYHGVGPVDSKNDELHIGGSTKLILQNELRYIVNKDVQIPFFFDIGSLDEEPLRLGTLRASTGLGVRFKMPGMNQRAYLYYAENLMKTPTDDNRSIHFGFSFDF